MGVADAIAPLSDTVQTRFRLSSATATLLPFFVFGAFAVFSVPGGLLASRLGRKRVLLLGLGINALAMAVPSVFDPGFAALLACIFALGVGTTLLQVAGNPILRDVSVEGAYGRNLSFAQGIKGVGSAGSSWLVATVSGFSLFAFLNHMGWRGSFPLFFALMAVAFASVAIVRIDARKPAVPPSIGSSLRLLRMPEVTLSVIGIFLYVGAEVCMGRFLLPGLLGMGCSPEVASRFGVPMFFVILTVGRLLGSALLTVISARALFRISSLLGMFGSAILMTGSGALAIPAVVIAGLGFANIWPVLFSLAVEKIPERASELSGLMCMAISGGAVVPLLMGVLIDHDLRSLAFVIPGLCFAYLLAISLRERAAA